MPYKYLGVAETDIPGAAQGSAPAEPAQQSKGYLSELLGSVGGVAKQVGYGGVEALSSLLGFPGYLQEVTSGPQFEQIGKQEARFPRSQEISEFLLRGKRPQPQGTAEETASRFGGNAVISAALAPVTGGLSLIPAAAGAVGAQAGKEIVGEGWPEIIGGLLGNVGTDFVKKGFQGFIKSARTEGSKLQKQYYNEAKPFAAAIKLPSSDVSKAILSVEKEASEKLPVSALKQFRSDIRPLEHLLKSKEISLDKVWNEKIRLNSAIRELENPTPLLKRYYNGTLKSLNTVLQDYGNKNPKFGVPFNEAEDLTRGLNSISTLRKVIEENTDLEKLFSKGGKSAKYLAGGLAAGSYFNPTKLALTTAVGIPGALATRSALRGYDLFANSSQGKKLLAKSLEEAAFGDVTGLAHTLRSITKGIEPKSRYKYLGVAQ